MPRPTRPELFGAFRRITDELYVAAAPLEITRRAAEETVAILRRRNPNDDVRLCRVVLHDLKDSAE